MKIDRMFLVIGVAYILVGLLLGFHMGRSGNHAQMPTHAHINMLGFVSMSIFAFAYRLWPKMQESMFAKWHFGLHQTMAPIMLITLYLVIGEKIDGPTAGPIFTITEIGLILGYAMFAWNVWQNAKD